MAIIVINLYDGHIQVFSKAKDREGKSLRKDVGKKKENHGRKSRKTLQISSQKARKGQDKEEADSPTYTAKIDKKGRFHIQSVDSEPRFTLLRVKKSKVPWGNSVRTLDKKGKEKRKMGRA